MHKYLVIAYEVTGMTDEQVDGLVGEAWAQGEESERHPHATAVLSTDVDTEQPLTEGLLQGALNVGLGL